VVLFSLEKTVVVLEALSPLARLLLPPPLPLASCSRWFWFRA
jgi:hypothetical protein